VWIERSIGLKMTKTLAEGSTIAALKEALVADAILGSVSAEDLALYCSSKPHALLHDWQPITRDLVDLQLGSPDDASQEADVNEPEDESRVADLHEPEQESQEADIIEPQNEEIKMLPNILGTDVKWYCWNSMFASGNMEMARSCHGPKKLKMEELAKADQQRQKQHYEAAKASGMISEDCLLCILQQVEHAAGTAVAAGMQKKTMKVADIEVKPKPKEFGVELWEHLAAAIGAMAEGVALLVQAEFCSSEDEKHLCFRAAQASQMKFEGAWREICDGPPTPQAQDALSPSAEGAQRQSTTRMESNKNRREEGSVDQKQDELEFEKKENVRRTAAGASSMLGKPLAYMVLRDCPIYQEPIASATKVSSVRKGMKVYGYPGSAAWIRVNALSSNLSKENCILRENWVPVRSQESPEREQVLTALWHGLRAEKTLADSIEVVWPGVDQPKEPNVAEYTIQMRPKEESLAEVTTVVTGITKARAIVKGLKVDSEVQLRVCLRVVGEYTTDFRLKGPWVDFQTASEPNAAEAISEHTDVFASNGKRSDVEGEGIYEVVHDFVTLRGEPTTKGVIHGTLKKGTCIFGTPFKVGNEPWIKLSIQTIPPPTKEMPAREVSANESLFCLIDATCLPHLNLGILLKRVGDGSASDNARKRLGVWKVMGKQVPVRSRASIDAETIGVQNLGAEVLGVCLPIGGVDWLRVQNQGLLAISNQDLWILVDGRAKGHGRLERIRDAPQEALQKKRVADLKASKRPFPPRPLTVLWLAAHGGLPSPPIAVREVSLGDDVDVGMASECSALHVKPADGSEEVSYIAKRGANDWHSCSREYRFYTEVARHGVSPGASQPLHLGGALRVPCCFCANWGQKGQELAAFLLILERLDDPDWVPVDFEVGCTHTQACTAVVTLGKLHKFFEDPALQKLIEFLPITMLDIRHAGHFEIGFSHKLVAAKSLVQMLPPGAQATVERMARGGLGECIEQLAEPPYTLCHGDYRPENMRFSAPHMPPAVAAFDWGLANRASGIMDFAYFLMLSMPPYERRAREHEMFALYLDARGQGQPDSKSWHELKTAGIVILACMLMFRHDIRNSDKVGNNKGARNMGCRMLRWVGEAITDWRAIDVLPGDN